MNDTSEPGRPRSGAERRARRVVEILAGVVLGAVFLAGSALFGYQVVRTLPGASTFYIVILVVTVPLAMWIVVMGLVTGIRLIRGERRHRLRTRRAQPPSAPPPDPHA